jgi:hypothetical protein
MTFRVMVKKNLERQAEAKNQGKISGVSVDGKLINPEMGLDQTGKGVCFDCYP